MSTASPGLPASPERPASAGWPPAPSGLPGSPGWLPASPGPANALIDVAGIRVGHHARSDGGYLSGTTVILAPDGGMVAGVDVRGGAPGTRETDLLAPTAANERVQAIVLTGGSAYGIAASCGVADDLGRRGIGLPVGHGAGEVVPIVPAAVLFDLGRGGDFAARPDASFGVAAVRAALEGGGEGSGEGGGDGAGAAACGCIGAGTGAVAGGIKGGIGQASVLLDDGSTVAALVAANAFGSPVDLVTGELLGARLLLPGDGPAPAPPTPAERTALRDLAAARLAEHRRTGARASTGTSAGTSTGTSTAHPVRNTTIGILATDATLSKAQCGKLAGVGHDGLARAVNPIHTLFDGDTLFAAATGARPAPDLFGYQAILSAAADVVTRAMVRAMLAARGVQTAGGSWPSYLELAPSVLDSTGRPR